MTRPSENQSVDWPFCRPSALDNPDLEKEIEALLSGMSLAQKVGQMIQPDIRYITPEALGEYQIGSVLSGGGAHPQGNYRASVQDWVALADAYYDAALDAGMAVPPMWGIDAIHGNNNIFGATVFPHNIGLGAAGDADLVARIHRATAVEVAATGIDWTFAPTVAVARDDRWGRTYESFSESTDLVTALTTPAMTGLQGHPGKTDFMQGPHVIATAKHYLGDGGTDGGVDQGDTPCDEDTLRTLHGTPYLAAIRAGAQVVMASFNSWRGQKLHGHQYLVQTVLKDRLGFDGFVISDWNGHGQLPDSSNTRGHEAINAGVDMLMAPEDWQALLNTTIDQVTAGDISMTRIDDAVRRILRVKLRAGLRFPNRPSSRPLARTPDFVGSPEHRDLARRAVRNSAVLLKNNNDVLPLPVNARILVTGTGADNIPMQCGGWSLTWQGDGTTNDDFPGATSIYAGLRDTLARYGGEAVLDADLTGLSSTHTYFNAAVVVFGERPYAEGPGDRRHLSHSATTGSDVQLLRALKALGIPVVSVFLSGRPLWVNPELNASDAFVAAWLPGTEGAGIAELLTGQEDFVGRLPMSWPATPRQSPLNIGDVDYAPLFPYGYGLTFSNNQVVPDDLSEDDDTLVTLADRLDVFSRGPVEPFDAYVGDAADWRVPVRGSRSVSTNRLIEVRVSDRNVQEDTRRIRWHGGPAQFYFASEDSIDGRALFSQGTKLSFTVCVHTPPTHHVFLRQDSGYPEGGAVDITELLTDLPAGEWHTVNIETSRFITAGLHTERLTCPFLIWTDGTLDLSIHHVGLINNTNNAPNLEP